MGNHILLDRVRGCLFGGAAGDALGYAVEFSSMEEITDTFGPKGITQYHLTDGLARISDDTQMTLFTAQGLCYKHPRNPFAKPREAVARAYIEWYLTQKADFDEVQKQFEPICSLTTNPDMFVHRAPGFTCLSALEELIDRAQPIEDYIAQVRNDSKGCGGVMRVAPMGLSRKYNVRLLDVEAAQIAAITHCNSLGYLPAAVLCHIIHRLYLPLTPQVDLEKIALEAMDAVGMLFKGDPNLPELMTLLHSAIALSKNHRSDLENIQALGDGWVAEEALAIALYCALRHQSDFSAGIIAAVNHDGDSDSTGAIAGNILGVLHGYDAIDQKWKAQLELSPVILQTADDLFAQWSN